MKQDNEIVLESLLKDEKWVEKNNYKGYEPFDGLSSYFRPLTFGNLFLDRLLLQLVRQSPVNLRPLFGVKHQESTIGRGYMAWGYATMFEVTGDGAYEDKIRLCLDWLIENKSPGYEDFSWGKHFDFASRGGGYPAFEPITIWTVLIGYAFLDAYAVLEEERYLTVAKGICDWLFKLPLNKTPTGSCIGYLPDDKKSTIHNHNMHAAAFLARTGKYIGASEHLELARELMEYSCSRQLENGGWYYGDHQTFHWIDNFHTGYNLDALKCYIEHTEDNRYKESLNKGLNFYKNHFFEDTGRPKYYHSRTFPVDSQCISQSIETLTHFSDTDEQSLELAIKVSKWAISNMQDKAGYFYYRQYPLGIMAKTPMLHWAQATMYRALALLYKTIC